MLHTYVFQTAEFRRRIEKIIRIIHDVLKSLSMRFSFSTHVYILIRGRVDVSTFSGNRGRRLKF